MREQIEFVESEVLLYHLNITVKTSWNITYKFRIRKDSKQYRITNLLHCKITTNQKLIVTISDDSELLPQEAYNGWN